MLFLHSREHHLEETKRAIDLFCTIKTQAPEFFTRRDPLSQEIQYIQHVIKICLLPRKTLDDYRMIFVRPHDYDPSHFFLNPAIKLLFMVLDVSLKEDGLATRGLILIFDMKGVVLGHISRIILTSVKKYFLYEQ
ncbi:unnamed protein product, partial [Timema podura]|nr:unnamed protein product [Timema podura]